MIPVGEAHEDPTRSGQIIPAALNNHQAITGKRARLGEFGGGLGAMSSKLGLAGGCHGSRRCLGSAGAGGCHASRRVQGAGRVKYMAGGCHSQELI